MGQGRADRASEHLTYLMARALSWRETFRPRIHATLAPYPVKLWIAPVPSSPASRRGAAAMRSKIPRKSRVVWIIAGMWACAAFIIVAQGLLA